MGLIKVVHIIGGGEFGGAERHIINLAGALNPQMVEVTVCCLFSDPFVGIAAQAGLNAFDVTMRNRTDLSVVGKLASIIRNNNFDIVHTHGVRANLLGRLAARQANRKPVVTTVHSLLERDYPGFFRRQVNSITERATRGWTDQFIAVSQGLKAKLVAGGVPADRVTVIYNGIVIEDFSPSSETAGARTMLGYGPAVPLVGIVARLHPVKGHQYFLEAARIVLEQHPEVRFVVVGEGPQRPALEEMAGQLGIAGQVAFTGFVSEVRSVMADLDLLVISSLWEGFGLTAVEAMALGIPVVSTEVGGLPEVVLHGETGLLAPPANSAALAKNIIWMLEHPQAAAEMAKKASQVVGEKFTAQVMARRTEELYRRVAGCEN
ncbi:D-inositol 3-phosphate glycosyltransferase [Pelotomaculum schinkii]|uniref:D-inositol 3-phosphate glycosyltransferase n=1 Tax=Pelotomaculum schinkii TaxID=78350 RepID=A0A4Y7R5N8_9FIRM|nr:glycosyltransferase family 4 protein [Pelotomaculum schinkii]TEB04284.1 D-inositol 3-phosphate glycosyltransferase [Pelotomaculum schinkii]